LSRQNGRLSDYLNTLPPAYAFNPYAYSRPVVVSIFSIIIPPYFRGFPRAGGNRGHLASVVLESHLPRGGILPGVSRSTFSNAASIFSMSEAFRTPCDFVHVEWRVPQCHADPPSSSQYHNFSIPSAGIGPMRAISGARPTILTLRFLSAISRTTATYSGGNRLSVCSTILSLLRNTSVGAPPRHSGASSYGVFRFEGRWPSVQNPVVPANPSAQTGAIQSSQALLRFSWSPVSRQWAGAFFDARNQVAGTGDPTNGPNAGAWAAMNQPWSFPADGNV